MSKRQLDQLRRLARLYGVLTSYIDAKGVRREAAPAALEAVLKALGLSDETLANLPAAIKARQLEEWLQVLQPVLVVWNNEAITAELRLPADLIGTIDCRLELENGESRSWRAEIDSLQTGESMELADQRFITRLLPLPEQLPFGYHRLKLSLADNNYEALLISAPSKVYQAKTDKMWGLFIPLYALHSERSWGSGDFTDLGNLMDWVRDKGGQVVGTLPLLAAFLDGPSYEPSPYAPHSRLFWNELFVDVTNNAELAQTPAAQALIDSPEFQQELAEIRALKLVDYRRQMALKRRVLELLAQTFFAGNYENNPAYQGFLVETPAARDYAEYRAACEKQDSSWMAWSGPQRDGQLTAADYDEANKQYHLYVQWLAHEQLQVLSQRGRERGQEIYLDLPLGVHPDGYDVWRERDAFALGISVGAPPDIIFTEGQSWGFPPLHPERLRKQGYSYYINGLRNHLKYASLLRVDHVMGLHRFYWVPQGMKATEGVYVTYQAEEFYAIMSLESHRYKASIVGENLGTVPAYINAAMSRHSLHQLYVIQYELVPDAEKALRKVGADTLASINTHDMPPFAAYWEGSDIDDRFTLGILTGEQIVESRQERAATRKALIEFLRQRNLLNGDSDDVRAVLRACLKFLSSSPSRAALINLEDLWLEVLPQNIPGTHRERPNWQRKSRYKFEGFTQSPEVMEIISEVDELRRNGKSHRKTKSAKM